MKTPFAITLGVGSGLANRTGNWRMERPAYVDRTPPCNDACPTGENIQGWLYHASSNDFEAAWRKLVIDNPFPALSGRVCHHPCETVCHRVQMDGAVGVQSIEAFLGDQAVAHQWAFPDLPSATGRPVLVVGSGPAGLAAAYHLRRAGHLVTIREAADHTGGLIREWMSESVLPRQIFEAEIRRVLDLGIDLELESAVTSTPDVGPECQFAAALFATGTADGQALISATAGIFQVGDSSRDNTVIAALGDGKRAARQLHEWLAGNPVATPRRLESARFDHLNTWYYSDAPRSPAVGAGQVLEAAQALYEARRCLSCGGCFECDNCFSVCPDNAVIKLGRGRGYEFDLDYCKGCGICVAECPSGAIVMEPETL